MNSSIGSLHIERKIKYAADVIIPDFIMHVLPMIMKSNSGKLDEMFHISGLTSLRLI